MVPHKEAVMKLTEFALAEIFRHIRPSPDLHNPDQYSCWLWKGTAKTPVKTKRQTRLTYQGRAVYSRNESASPYLHLWGGHRLDVRRLLFLLYFQPKMPFYRLKRHCHEELCVNPYHYSVIESDKPRSSTLWPQLSPLDTLFDYLGGYLAQDPQSLSESTERRLRIEIQYKRALQEDYEIIPKQNYAFMQERLRQLDAILAGGAENLPPESIAKLVPSVKQIHSVAMRRWLINKDGTVFTGAREDYDCTAHYVSVLRRWFPELTVEALSPDVLALLEYYSCELPYLSKSADINDYWIGQNDCGDGFSILDEAMQARVTKGSQVLAWDKQVNFRLCLLKLDELRASEIERVDWTL